MTRFFITHFSFDSESTQSQLSVSVQNYHSGPTTLKQQGTDYYSTSTRHSSQTLPANQPQARQNVLHSSILPPRHRHHRHHDYDNTRNITCYCNNLTSSHCTCHFPSPFTYSTSYIYTGYRNPRRSCRRYTCRWPPLPLSHRLLACQIQTVDY